MATNTQLELRGIAKEDIPLGSPLPCPIYDREGNLLIKAGEVINSHRQLDDLRVDGLFIPKRPTQETPPEPPKQSPIALLDALSKTVERLFGWMTAEPNFPGRTRSVSKVVQEACGIDKHACLGWIFLGCDARYVVAHPLHTAIVCELVATQMGWSAEDRLVLIDAALTMNVAQLVLQHKLHGQTQPLTPPQRAEINTHALAGYDLLKELQVTEPRWLDAVAQHHERLDGSGYPNALKGDAIAPFARLLAVADVYCALVSDHPHRHAMASNAALKELYLQRGTKLDGAMVEQLIKVTGVYAPGTLVRLACGEIAVITQHGASPNTPVVYSVISPRGAALNVYQRRDTAQAEFAIKEVLSRAKANVTISQKGRLWGYK